MKRREFIKYLINGSLLASAFFISSKVKASLHLSLLKKISIVDKWKWRRKALYYSVYENNKVLCNLCPNACILASGERGICKTRVNDNGILFTHTYGNPCAVHNDPVEKKPLFHFLPGTRTYSIATAGCNLACLNCQNWSISQIKPEDATNYDMSPSVIVDNAVSKGAPSISYTYTEPVTFYEYVLDTSKLAKARGLKNVLVSNGYINEKPLKELCQYIDAANIDLKSFNNDIYRKLNRGSLNPVLQTLKVLKENNVWLEITNLIIPSWSDDIQMITDMCQWLVDNGFAYFPLHFTRFFPAYKLTNLPITPLSTLQKAREIAIQKGIKFVYIGNVPEAPQYENTICPNCFQIIVERKGNVINLSNIKNGHCKFCNTKIPGVWSNDI
ncbi:MAG TPA: AmmeMemoRadiSam system radical SAM enzyme [Bacteroidales bacterium]|nr:AmmeMemoRadiSam system radical SAM enzyme [Bacteroidales bacterium]